MTEHNVLEARNNLSRLIAESRTGRDVVITKRGKPVARLVPVDDDIELTGAELARWLDERPLPGRLATTPAELDGRVAGLRDGWE